MSWDRFDICEALEPESLTENGREIYDRLVREKVYQ